MDVIFQVDVRKKNRKLEERYRRTAFDLYRKGTRRSAGAWVLLIWYSIVLIISLGGGVEPIRCAVLLLRRCWCSFGF